MELYTLNAQFQRDKPIDTFESVIWTERYGKAGDVTLVVEPSLAMVEALVEGTFLALEGSKEVMLLETALQQDGVLKVTGNTLDLFLNQRIVVAQTASALYRIMFESMPPTTPEGLMNDAVAKLLVPGGIQANWDLGFDGPRQVFPNLSVDRSGPYGPAAVATIPFGPMYDAFVQLCQTYLSGFSLYLDSATEAGYSLKFKAYHGRDLTSDQTTYPLVRFSPNLDSLTGVSKLRSIAKYRNVAYVFPSDSVTETLPSTPGVAFANADAEESTGFDRRVIMAVASDITPDSVGNNAFTLLNALTQKARDLLANNNYTKVVDGEVVPQSEYQYGNHYKLGDYVELDDGDDTVQLAQITEYIRSQDSSGERSYPTVAVVDSIPTEPIWGDGI